jgi:hypothetical protein
MLVGKEEEEAPQYYNFRHLGSCEEDRGQKRLETPLTGIQRGNWKGGEIEKRAIGSFHLLP